MTTLYNRLWLWTTFALLASQYLRAETRIQHHLGEVNEQVSHVSPLTPDLGMTALMGSGGIGNESPAYLLKIRVLRSTLSDNADGCVYFNGK